MIFPDLTRQIFPAEPHQVEGTTFLMNQQRAFLGDTPGAGKSKQVIDAACNLSLLGDINAVVILCPAQVALAWCDPVLGEILKHCYIPSTITRFASKSPIVPDDPARLPWVVISFEMARMKERRVWLTNELRGRRCLVVIDESLGVADVNTEQHRAMKDIVGKHALYAWELNGTPGNPLQVYGQFEVLDPRIIGVKNVFHFKSRYVQEVPIVPGSKIKKIIGYYNKDLLDARLARHVLRRCPPLSVARATMAPIGVRLPESIWRMYRMMRDQALAELQTGDVSTARNAMARCLRLCQMTGGFVGGVERGPLEVALVGMPAEPVRWLHDSKVEAAISWCQDRWNEDPEARLIIWCRFTDERRHLMERLRSTHVTGTKRYPQVWGLGKGDNKPADKQLFLRELSPSTRSAGPGVGIAQPQAGGRGLTLVAAHDMMYYSQTWSWVDREQTEGRTARKGQTEDCRFWDLVAEGPDGQRTVDHKVVEAVRKGADIAEWTVEDWASALREEVHG